MNTKDKTTMQQALSHSERRQTCINVAEHLKGRDARVMMLFATTEQTYIPHNAIHEAMRFRGPIGSVDDTLTHVNARMRQTMLRLKFDTLLRIQRDPPRIPRVAQPNNTKRYFLVLA